MLNTARTFWNIDLLMPCEGVYKKVRVETMHLIYYAIDTEPTMIIIFIRHGGLRGHFGLGSKIWSGFDPVLKSPISTATVELGRGDQSKYLRKTQHLSIKSWQQGTQMLTVC